MDDNVYIALIDVNEEIKDIKRKLKFLECDSYNRLVTLYFKHTPQPEIHSELEQSIGIANNLKHAIKSILLPYKSSTTSSTTFLPTADLVLIPGCIKVIRSKIIYLILIFDHLRTNQMKSYMRSVMLRLKEAVSSLSVATGISINISDVNHVVSINDDDRDDLAVMMMIVLNEAVKELRHEEIEKGMKELEQVLFEMYVMVQKPYMVMNGGNGELHENIESLVKRNDELVRRNDEAYWKQYYAEKKRYGIIICVVLLVAILFSNFHGIIKEIGDFVLVCIIGGVLPLSVLILCSSPGPPKSDHLMMI